MTMNEWAKREVEIACKKENPNWDGESFDYGCLTTNSTISNEIKNPLYNNLIIDCEYIW